MPNSSEKSWFVAHCKPNACYIAKINLERQGFKTFLPQLALTKRKKTEFQRELTPLFPSYIFILFNMESLKWASINNTLGIKSLISADKIPQAISSNFIHSLMARCDDKGVIQTNQEIVTGQEIKINKGPFSQSIAVVDQVDAKERVTLLLNMMGQKTKVTVDRKIL